MLQRSQISGPRSAHQVESPAPARLVEEVHQHSTELLCAIAHAGAVLVFFRGNERPINEERPADDVFTRHESPEAAVEAVQSVVAHGEVVGGGNDEIAILDMTWQIVRPGWLDVLPLCGGHVREFVAIGRVVAVIGMAGLRLILPLAIQVHISFVEMNVVAGNADDAKYMADWLAVAKGQDADFLGPLGGADHVTPGSTNGYNAYLSMMSLVLAMRNAGFTGKADTDKLVSAFETLNVKQGADIPDGDLIMNKDDHQGRTNYYLLQVNGQKEDVVQTFPANELPMIGDCKIQG